MEFYLEVIGIASQKAINAATERGTKYSISDLMGLFCSYTEFDIPLGHTFSYLIKKEKFSFSIFCEIKLVTQGWGLLFDQIPLGHKTLCFVKLDNETKRLLMENLMVVDDWGYYSEHLYLSDTPTFSIV